MDKGLRKLMRNLKNAIDASLMESDSVAEAIGEINQKGYDVLFFLEATPGQMEPGEGTGDESAQEPQTEPIPEPKSFVDADGNVARKRWTMQDRRFLGLLKINVNE
jgi:hypothetical protein